MKFNLAKTTVGIVAGALFALSGVCYAQPRWGSDSSPAPATSTSQKANDAADRAVYKPIECSNAAKPVRRWS
jgi:hypothetical protein